MNEYLIEDEETGELFGVEAACFDDMFAIIEKEYEAPQHPMNYTQVPCGTLEMLGVDVY